MSIPISYCLLVQAADSEEAFAKVYPIMKKNLECGHYSVYPCEHDPRCRQLSEDEIGKLFDRFRK